MSSTETKETDSVRKVKQTAYLKMSGKYEVEVLVIKESVLYGQER